MSDTPETDAARMFGYGEFGGDWVLLERNCYEKHPEGDVIFSEVAEKLERERDDALKEWDIAREGWSKALEERDEARRELDELRKKLDDSDTVMKATLSDETLKDPFATAALHKLMDEKHIWPNAWRTTLPTCELDRVNE